MPPVRANRTRTKASSNAFLATTPDFAPLDARQAAPRLSPEVIDARGHLRTEPIPTASKRSSALFLSKAVRAAEC
jgi:hypothetical protein